MKLSQPSQRLHSLDSYLNLSAGTCSAGALVGLLVVTMFLRSEIFQLSEYVVLYAGARLVGTPFLYDKERNRQEQIVAINGQGGDELVYSRPPFVAALIWPLGKIPYRGSLVIFEALSFLALVGFVLLWPESRACFVALVCAWSLPLASNFAFARDVTFLLLLLALALRNFRRMPFISGLILSLLGIKFHLFLLLPLLLIAQRRWRIAAGFTAGCAGLSALSFAVAGRAWPLQMAQVIRTSTIPRQYVLPNLRGMLQFVTDSVVPEFILALVVAAIVYYLARRSDFEYGVCAVISGSLLVSHHAGIYDCALLIPVLLIAGANGDTKSTIWCFVILSPVPYLLLSLGGVASLLAQLVFASVLLLLVLQLTRPGSWTRQATC